MQTLDNSIQFRPRRRYYAPGVRLKTVDDKMHPNPRCIPIANRAAEIAAKQTNGFAQSSVPEVLMNVPTAAILPKSESDFFSEAPVSLIEVTA